MRRLRLFAAFVLFAGALLSPLAASDVDAAYRLGVDLLSPYLILADRKPADANTPKGRADIQAGIQALTQVVDAYPDNWPAFWLIGKGHQVLRDHDSAQSAFARAYAINPNHTDVARELVIESICVGKTEVAVTVAEAATRIDTHDPGLAANLGLALLADGQLERAKTVTEDALRMSPDDTIIQSLLAEVTAVQAGRPPSNYCPP